MKNKLELKKQKSLEKMEFMQTIRDRIHYDSQQKSKVMSFPNLVQIKTGLIIVIFKIKGKRIEIRNEEINSKGKTNSLFQKSINGVRTENS